MIAGVKGKVVHIDINYVCISNDLLTWQVYCSPLVLGQMQIGKKVALHTYLKVAENEMSLFGFAEKGELRLFEKLIGVSGVGPKTALEILSLGAGTVRQAIEAGDWQTLNDVKGIGKKTAQKMIVELQSAIAKLDLGKMVAAAPKKHIDEALTALQGLGFRSNEIKQFLDLVEIEFETAEEVVQAFLRSRG